MGWREKNQPPDVPWCWAGFRPHLGSIYRRPRTTAAIRAADPEFERAKRSRRQLPDAWDDIVRGSQRSWKKHRRAQYRPR